MVLSPKSSGIGDSHISIQRTVTEVQRKRGDERSIRTPFHQRSGSVRTQFAGKTQTASIAVWRSSRKNRWLPLQVVGPIPGSIRPAFHTRGRRSLRKRLLRRNPAHRETERAGAGLQPDWRQDWLPRKAARGRLTIGRRFDNLPHKVLRHRHLGRGFPESWETLHA
jgi:hypothetical protein